MAVYRFEVQGSASEPYIVTIERRENNLRAYCTCPAGENGQYCKHRFSLLEGNSKGVVGGDIDAISTLPRLLQGTDVADALADLRDAEKKVAAAKKEESTAKRAVAAAMRS